MRKLTITFLILAACGLGSLFFPPPEPAFACASTTCNAPEGAGCNGTACYTALTQRFAG